MRWLGLIFLLAAAARADQNDLELWRLGHPDDLNCTRCDGLPGADPKEPGTIDSQARFHRLVSTLGLAFAPPFQETAGTLGQSGFELGLTSQQVFLNMPADSWATQGTQATAAAPRVLLLPTLAVRKGLGGSLELGVAISWLANSQMIGLSAEARWALIDGVNNAPDFAFRAWGTRVVGARDLDLTSAGADAAFSKSFGIAGMVKLQPYLQGGIAFVNAASSVIDFKPNVESNGNPTADDGVFRNVSLFNNRFLRAAAGVRLVAGVVVLGVEGALAQGSNAIQDSPPAGAPTNFVRVWSLAGRLGFSY